MFKLYLVALPITLTVACTVGDSGPAVDTGPDAGQTGLAPNSGEVNGSVHGRTMSGVGSAFYIDLDDGLFAIVLGEGDKSCDPEAETGKIVGFPMCGPATPGDYAITDDVELDVDCGAGVRLAEALFEESDGEDIDEGDSGTLTIETITATSVAGRFRAGFGAEQLTGRFNAVVCDAN